MTARTRVGGLYEWAIVCDVCGKTRAHGNHKKCSKIRQAARQKERDQATQHENVSSAKIQASAILNTPE